MEERVQTLTKGHHPNSVEDGAESVSGESVGKAASAVRSQLWAVASQDVQAPLR